MIYGITYADERMSRSAEVCVASMLKHGIERAGNYDPGHIDIHFFNDNRNILSSPRGCGYWLWKPYIVNAYIKTLNNNDYLVYSDAGVEWVNSVKYIIDRMDQDIFFFTNGFPHVEWCKWDVLDGTGAYLSMTKAGDNLGYTDLRRHKQVQASVIVFKVNENTRRFVKEWLLWCQMPGFIDDSPSKLPNYPTFAEHRHDQAILTCLQIKYGYKLHFWPTLYSEHIRHTAQPEDNYPTLFNHHRKRNPGMGEGEPEW